MSITADSKGHVVPRVRPRPRWLKALGASEPPERIEIGGREFRQVELFEHDSWAATALYESVDGTAPAVVCKFQRQQSLLGLPIRWAGRWMARHEAGLIARLADLEGVPRLCGPVSKEGRRLPYAVARWYIPGHPLGKQEPVNDAFFPRLAALLAEIHARRMAYVDLHKRENIIVGADGSPYLIDFQIGIRRPGWMPVGLMTRLLQRSDDYHLRKHWARHRPDQCGFTLDELAARRPWYIRLHRLFAQPFREARRRLLVLVKVRSGRGHVETELLPEDAVRADLARLRDQAA